MTTLIGIALGLPWWVWAALITVLVGMVVVRSMPRTGLYAHETYIGIDQPIALQGRPDQVMWVGRALRVEELKTRERSTVYDSDIWQLSMYKYILRRVQRHRVLDEARVWVKVGDRLEPHDVVLKTDQEVEALYARYQALNRRQAEPQLCNKPRYCQRCSHHQVRCFPPATGVSKPARAQR